MISLVEEYLYKTHIVDALGIRYQVGDRFASGRSTYLVLEIENDVFTWYNEQFDKTGVSKIDAFRTLNTERK